MPTLIPGPHFKNACVHHNLPTAHSLQVHLFASLGSTSHLPRAFPVYCSTHHTTSVRGVHSYTGLYDLDRSHTCRTTWAGPARLGHLTTRLRACTPACRAAAWPAHFYLWVHTWVSPLPGCTTCLHHNAPASPPPPACCSPHSHTCTHTTSCTRFSPLNTAWWTLLYRWCYTAMGSLREHTSHYSAFALLLPHLRVTCTPASPRSAAPACHYHCLPISGCILQILHTDHRTGLHWARRCPTDTH